MMDDVYRLVTELQNHGIYRAKLYIWDSIIEYDCTDVVNKDYSKLGSARVKMKKNSEKYKEILQQDT